MGKFNAKVPSRSRTRNEAGGHAYKHDPKTQVATMLLSNMVKDSFYSTADKDLSELIEAMNKVDPKFCAKAILFARDEFRMRSVSHAAAAELSSRASGTTWAKHFYERLVMRPDDVTETIAYYHANIKKCEPNAMRKGFGAALAKMDEYQLAKYKGSGNFVSMVDAVNMFHPAPNDRLKALVKGTIKPPGTWEVGLSAAGRDSKKKESAWSDLLSEGKLGYMALLKNLRNILEQAPKMVTEACRQLTDEKAIKKSMVLPFRYMVAFDAVKQVQHAHAGKVMRSLSEAMDIAVCNVPKLSGETLVVVDDSGSMQHAEVRPSGPGQVKAGTSVMEMAALFAAAFMKRNPDAHYMQFSSDARYVNLNTMDSTLSIQKEIMRNTVPRQTNFHSIFDTANSAYDRVIILSDMNGWSDHRGGFADSTAMRSYNRYCDNYECKPRIFSMDLRGNSTTQFPEQHIACLAGFSEKVFDVMAMLDEDPKALVNRIEQIEL